RLRSLERWLPIDPLVRTGGAPAEGAVLGALGRRLPGRVAPRVPADPPPQPSVGWPPEDALLAPDALRARIRREAVLAERGNLEYSVTVFDVRQWATDGGALRRLVCAVRGVMLPGDDLGWLGAGRLALSQPLTDALTALLWAAGIARVSASPGCCVYSQHVRVRDAREHRELPHVPLRPLSQLLCDPLPRRERI